MATFVITYDAHKVRSYDAFYAAMDEFSGVRLAESVWGIELNNTAVEVRDWVHALLDDDDKIVVLKVFPDRSWATSHASKEATDWLKAHF